MARSEQARMRGDRLTAVVQQEAAAWALKLQATDVSVEEFSEWQQWLAQSDEHARAYLAMEKTLVQTANADLSDLWPSEEELAADNYAGEVAVADYVDELPPEVMPSGFVLSRWLAPAGGVLTAGLLVLALIIGMGGSKQNASDAQVAAMDVRTERAEHKRVSLADGSVLDVGASTDVSVELSDGTRRIALNAGEAYFDVAPDKSRPFVVSTSLGDVIAVGTEFNVRQSDDYLMVTVTEGRVRVEPNAYMSGAGGTLPDSLEVSAGKAVRLTRNGSNLNIATQAALPLAWQDGRLSYRSEPLKYVVADLNRYSRQPIEIEDSSIGELRYSGTLLLSAKREWLEALPGAFPVRLETREDGSYALLQQ